MSMSLSRTEILVPIEPEDSKADFLCMTVLDFTTLLIRHFYWNCNLFLSRFMAHLLKSFSKILTLSERQSAGPEGFGKGFLFVAAACCALHDLGLSEPGGQRGYGPPDFDRTLFEPGRQVVPTSLLLPPWIFRPSYGFPCPRWPPPCPPPTPPPTALTSSHSKPWTLVCTCWLMHQGTWMSSWCVLWLLSFHERNAKLGIRDWHSYPKIKIQRSFFLNFWNKLATSIWFFFLEFMSSYQSTFLMNSSQPVLHTKLCSALCNFVH